VFTVKKVFQRTARSICRNRAAQAATRTLREASVLPEVLDPIRRQRGVAHRADDRAVPQVVLDRPRVLAVVGELIAAAMPKHVAVDEKPEPSGLSGPVNHALIAGHAERCAALAHEHVWAMQSGSDHVPL
jgi:hypothetical protein